MDATALEIGWGIASAIMTSNLISLFWRAWHVVHLLQPATPGWTAPAWLVPSLDLDWGVMRHWSRRRQVITALLATFLVVGPLTYSAFAQTTGVVPPSAAVWTMAVAAAVVACGLATSAYGLWSLSRLGWKSLA